MARPCPLTCRCVAERVILDDKKSTQHWRSVEYVLVGAKPDIVLGNDLWRKLPEKVPMAVSRLFVRAGKDLRRSVYVVNGRNVVAWRVRHPAAGSGHRGIPRS